MITCLVIACLASVRTLVAAVAATIPSQAARILSSQAKRRVGGGQAGKTAPPHSHSPHPRRSALAIACLATLGLLAVGAGAAGAASAASYENFCVKLGTPAFCTAGGNQFGLAVDNSGNLETKGDVYVATVNGSVSRFKANGEAASFTGKNGNISGNTVGGFAETISVTVDASGNFYVTDRAAGANAVDKFTPEGEPEPTGSFTPAGFTEITAIAVDNSSGSSKGDVWLSENAAKSVDKFSPAGALIKEIKDVAHPNNNPYGLAIDQNGNVYVANHGENVQEFNESGTWVKTLNSSTAEAVAVDPSTEEVYVTDEGGATIQPYSSTGTALTPFAAGLTAFTPGLGVNGTTHFLYASNLSGSDIIFGFESKALEVTTGPAESITTTSATITGTVTPKEEPEATEIEFEWGLAGKVEEHKVPANVTSTKAEVKVHAELSGLQAGTKYVYRLSAKGGTETIKGAETPLETLGLATVTTEPASEVKIEGATLNGKLKLNVVGEGEYHFEYGTGTVEEGSTTATKFTDEATPAVPVSSLEPGKTYHARLVAVVEGKTIAGAEVEFNTPPVATATTEPATEVQVESAKLNGTPTLNPEVVGEGEYFFEYTPEGGLAKTTTATKFTGSPGTKSETVALEAGKKYKYQLVVVAAGHTINGLPSEEFTTPPKVVPVTEAPTGVGSEGATFHGKITSSSEATKYYFAYGEKGEGLLKRTPEGEVAENKVEQAVEAVVTGLTAGTEYEVELVAVTVTSKTEVKGEPPIPFTTLKSKPAVTNLEPVSVTRHGAQLSGEVNTEDIPTEYFIEYGETEAYGASGSPTATVQLPEAVGPTKITQALSELKTGTTYHYRIVATNATGTTDGPDATFETEEPQSPFELKFASLVTSPTTATLKAIVVANGLPTSYALEVGTEVGPGEITYTPSFGEVGSGSEPVELTFSETGLPGVTYHWRMMLINEDGTFTGHDHTFTTPGFPAVIIPPAIVPLIPFTPPKEEVKKQIKVETKAQKLAKALKQCKKIKSKHKRAACMKRAKKKYGPARRRSKGRKLQTVINRERSGSIGCAEACFRA